MMTDQYPKILEDFDFLMQLFGSTVAGRNPIVQGGIKELREMIDALVNLAHAVSAGRRSKEGAARPVTVILEREAPEATKYSENFAERVELSADEAAAVEAATKDMAPLDRHLFEERLSAWRGKADQ
jgi:hypothetical protein